MTTELIHVGFGNHLAVNHVIGIASPGSAPVKRLVQEGRKKHLTIDITSGRRTKAVVFMDNGSVVLAAITPETIAEKLQALEEMGSIPCHHGPLKLLAGPERIESGWWDGEDMARDYFIARTADAALLWVYRERSPAGAWYLHGIFS